MDLNIPWEILGQSTIARDAPGKTVDTHFLNKQKQSGIRTEKRDENKKVQMEKKRERYHSIRENFKNLRKIHGDSGQDFHSLSSTVSGNLPS